MQQLDDHEPAVLIQSVQRATRLLKAFDNGPAELGVMELSRRVDLHKARSRACSPRSSARG